MSGKRNIKTKDDLADFLLSEEGNRNDNPDQSQQKTSVINPKKELENDKTSVLPSLKDSSDKDKTKSISMHKSKLTEEIKKESQVSAQESSYKSTKTKDVAPRSENFFNKDNLDPSLFSLEAAIKQSEYLRIAQSKVKTLEKQVDELRSENETLSNSAIVLQKKYDEIVHKLDTFKLDQKAQIDNLKDEVVLKDRVIGELEKEKDILQRKNDEFQSLMSEKIHHIRVRERELQNRLEILQHEGDVVITNKDETILDLKKQIDQLHYEMDSYKAQSREFNQQIQNHKEQVRRSTKALRLALTLLENEDIDVSEIKKTGT